MKYFLIIPILCCLSIPAYGQEVLAAKTLSRGAQLVPSDLEFSDKQQGVDLDSFVGKELRRSVYRGSVIKTSDVREPLLVTRNSQVRMIYKIGAMEITAGGKALDEGSKGSLIRVMNINSRKKVEARVTGQGIVQVIK